jgi:pyrroline-5-carboxylate reductase
MNITFLGYGNMAKAFADGFLKQGLILSATAPSLPEVRNGSLQTHWDNTTFIKQSDIVFIATKPDKVNTVLAEITPLLSAKGILISVAAGLSYSWFLKHGLSTSQPFIRAMPNIAVKLGCGSIPLFKNASVTDKISAQCEKLFASLGKTVWVSQENDLDSFTALTGSGPAYIFEMMSAMVKGVTQLGLDETIAKEFCLQTFQGALALAAHENDSFEDLRKKVTSPNGTTQAALEVFFEHKFDKIIAKAIRAAFLRAQELATLE